MTRFTHAFHIADLHIRRTDARSHEYGHVFCELLRFLREQPSVRTGAALVVIAGDIFEDKRALDAYACTTLVDLVRELTGLAPLVVIPGNHDFAQTEPERPDRIAHVLEVMTACGKTAHPVHYLRDSGAHRIENVCVCTVSVYDTLSQTSGAGNIASLPPFVPSDVDPDAEFVVALAHATIRPVQGCSHAQAQAQADSRAHTHQDHTRGCSLAWFRDAGHKTVMLGDEHVPRTWRVPGPAGEADFVAAQPGSILAQTFGEPVVGHGVCAWDLVANEVTHHELNNPYAGVTAIRDADTSAINFRIKGANRSSDAAVSTQRAIAMSDEGMFPNKPRVRLLGDVQEHEVRRALEPGIRPCTCISDPMASALDFLAASGDRTGSRARRCSASERDDIGAELRDYMTKESMARYVRQHPVNADSSPEQVDQMASLLLDPARGLAMPSYPDAPASVRDALAAAQSFRGSQGRRPCGACVDAHLHAFEECRAPTHPRVVFRRLRGEHIAAYQSLDIDFAELPATTLVDGPNGAGKSSVLDVLKVAIYGLRGIGQNRMEFNTARFHGQNARRATMRYDIINASKPARKVCSTRFSFTHVRADEDGGDCDYTIERQLTPGASGVRESRARVLRSLTEEGGMEVCSGVMEVYKWVARFLGTTEAANMSAVLAQSCNTSFMGKSAADRQALIESALSLDAVSHMGAALEENKKGREKAIRLVDAALEDHSRARADTRPAPELAAEAERTRAGIARADAEAAAIDEERRGMLAQVTDVRRAMASHLCHTQNDPSSGQLQASLCSAQRALHELVEFGEAEQAQLQSARSRARDLELDVARLGPTPDRAGEQMRRATSARESAEATMAEMGDDPRMPRRDEAQGLLDGAQSAIQQLTSVATAVPKPYMSRASNLPDAADSPTSDADERANRADCAGARAEIDGLQARLRAMAPRSDPNLQKQWRADEAEWNELVARVGGKTPEQADEELERARRCAELRERERQLVAELGDRSGLCFDDACSACRANRERLGCERMQRELADVRCQLNSALPDTDVGAAEVLAREAAEVEARQAHMRERAQSWSRAAENDAAVDALESELARAWWAAWDAQERQLRESRAQAQRCESVIQCVAEVQRALQQEQEARAAVASAESIRERLDDLDAVNAQVASLLEGKGAAERARADVRHAHDDLLYSEVVQLDARQAEARRRLASLQGERAAQARAAEELEAWQARERRLLDIKVDLRSGLALVDRVHTIIAGRAGATCAGGQSYKAHVYTERILPQIRNAMNQFLDAAAPFRVATSGADLDVQFVGAGERGSTDPNQLGGADRFLLELAVRCALRQVGTPGFNWPVAFVDEGFVAFDAARRQRVETVLAALVRNGGFEKLVLTSHLECVRVACMRTLSIQRIGSVSVLAL